MKNCLTGSSAKAAYNHRSSNGIGSHLDTDPHSLLQAAKIGPDYLVQLLLKLHALPSPQIANQAEDPLLDEIRKLEIDNLSPIQALQELYRLRQQLTDRK